MATPGSELLGILASLGESASFCTAGKLAPVLPGLEVEGVGPIGIPLSPADAKRLVEQAAQAPYGRGEETIVDTDVRRVWQLEPQQFALQNAAWEPFIEGIVGAVREEFGISRKVRHQLYKLLIYEKGSFFAPHRDTEKTPGMFATLVVCLPSKHEGGSLIVTHDGQTRQIDFGGPDSEFQVQYAAFYADCQHEIQPVASGYRLCLIYNLALAQKKQPSAPASGPAVEAAAQRLAQLFADASIDKLVIPLKHQYSQAALAPGELKGSDRARVDVLVRAAQQLDYQVFLALMTHRQSGSVDYNTVDFSPYSSRRRYYDRYARYDDYDDEDDDDGDDDDYEDDEDGEDATGATFEEISDESMSLDHWRDAEGRPQPFGELSLDEGEILSDTPPEKWPYRQQIHEATGNEGASMDRWYHQAVTVIWPGDRYFQILASEGPEHAVPALEALVARTKRPSSDAGCLAFATAIVDRWFTSERSEFSWRSAQPGQPHLTARMVTILDQLKSAELAARFVGDVLPARCDGSEGPPLVRLINRLGWPEFAEPLRRVFASQAPDRHDRKLATPVALFEALCWLPPKMTEPRRAVCLGLAIELEQAFGRFDQPPRGAWWAKDEVRTGVVPGVVRGLAAIGDSQRLDRFLSTVLADPKRYDLHAVLIPAARELAADAGKRSEVQPAWNRLRDHCLGELRARTAAEPQPPADWAREANLSCRCADCRELAAFLKNPNEQVHRFPRRKELRQHLHQQIDHNQCDVTHVTARTGSPYTLVCTKTQASYKRRLAQFHRDVELLGELESLATGSSPSRRTRRRTKDR